MNRSHLLELLLLALLLLGSWYLGRGVLREANLAQPATGEPLDFRTWFWTHRSFDLAVQVGLVFVGALGVAAVLPREKEEECDLCTWL
ncbi:MAG TPA: hypothetical protein PLM06_01200 [Anaerolineae bacterium]|nr:hypothetical protein [Anaerolineae bacterium]HXK44057.1 hypothetical protein [Anaerolineae bacterium]